ncbi:hypothetical protein BU23DRAFT_4927 [Bimuria novae-zelandiae CBS 107.79]|uniref:Uncharacterized protein n=1 Tax=Bimuria novae-zelandiae CBS 107.79 TaxID=1447943 RepID=A0A6A5VUI1_9PLEO|nr:hypothetical protein BU23DRAFT_4927 [Bimuria novae-zelandiae CBS 107.79]
MLFNSFPASQTPSALQIIPYDGPPKPKNASRHNPSKKVPPSEEILGIMPESNTRRRDKEDPVHASHGSEVIDLTRLSGESDTENSGDESIGNGEHKSMRFEQSVSTATSREDFNVESPSQPAPPESSCQGTALVIKNSPPVSDTNESCPREDGVCTQTSNQSEDSSIWTPGFRGQVCSVRTEEAADGVGTLASGLPPCELTSTPPKPPIGSSMTNVEQPMLEASGHTLPKATTYQPQRQAYRKGQGKFPALEIASSGSNGSDDDDDDDSNHNIAEAQAETLASEAAQSNVKYDIGAAP